MTTTGVGSLQDRQVTKEGPTPVSARVSPTERIRAHIDELFAEDRPLPEVLEEVARLGAQLLMQAALEAEVTEFLGRDRYQRAAACEQSRGGSRNGYRPVQVKTTAGPVELFFFNDTATTEKFASRLFGAHITKTHALESLVIASFVRGLSVRDVEATLAEALGDQAAISKSTVSQVCQAIQGEYQAWTTRRLDGITLDYLFLDASFFRMHPGSPAEPILAAWGITTDGKPALIGLAPGTGESFDAWHEFEFLTDCKDRGLASPLLVISDGAKGLIAAVEQAFPAALRQRCLIHRLRNVLAKIPTGMQAEIKDAYWAVFDTADITTPPGPRLVEIIDRRIDALAAKYRTSYPAAVKILLTDRAGLTAYLRFPHRAPPPHPALQLHRTHLRRDPPTRQGHRPVPRRNLVHQHRLGRARPRRPRLARLHHDRQRAAPAARPPPLATPTTHPVTATHSSHRRPGHRCPRNCHSRRVTSPQTEPRPSIYTGSRTPPSRPVQGGHDRLGVVLPPDGASCYSDSRLWSSSSSSGVVWSRP